MKRTFFSWLALAGLVLVAPSAEAGQMAARGCGCGQAGGGVAHNYYTYGGAGGPVSRGYYNPAPWGYGTTPVVATAPTQRVGWAAPRARTWTQQPAAPVQGMVYTRPW
ncbi:MAG: hypothetical protein U0794_05705 [Isosphaeraceae bacterium]